MATPAPEIFKAYDIRGIYGEQIDGDVAERIGRAFARVLVGARGQARDELRVGLGHDMRLARPGARGALPRGAHGARARTCSTRAWSATEMLYFLVGSRELDGGLMCTASHNPKAYTGREARARGRAGALRRHAASKTSAGSWPAGAARRCGRRRERRRRTLRRRRRRAGRTSSADSRTPRSRLHRPRRGAAR